MREAIGYNFKTGKLTDDQRRLLDDGLIEFDTFTGGGSEWKIQDKTFLLRTKPWTKLIIYGIGPATEEVSDGIVWGPNENDIKQILYCINKAFFDSNGCYPYIVDPGSIYFVEDGEIYFLFKKGDRVSTPLGNGMIFSIDDLHDICVELDSDKNVYYEFMVTELIKIKE